MGFPVAIKILSPSISHKSDVGGVALDLANAQQVLDATTSMIERVKTLKPMAKIDGFTVQRMSRLPDAHETLVGAYTDPTFGPVIMFGQGGTAVEIVKDRAVALPPLNSVLARDLIGRLLVKDQSKRIKLADLPKHPWVQHHIANRGQPAASSSSQSQGMNR